MSNMRALAGCAVVAILAAAAPAAGSHLGGGVPAPPQLGTLEAHQDELSAVAGTQGVGRYSATYDPRTQTLRWRLDYKQTTGPATAVRVRARIGLRTMARTLCSHCESVARSSKKGPYSSVSGVIRSPSRDLVLLATPSLFSGQSQVVLATADYPRGELFGSLPEPPATGTGGGRCC